MRLEILWALFIASVKMFVRNRAAVFFSLVLPLIIMLIFGVLNFEGTTELDVGIVDQAANEASAALSQRLEAYDYLILHSGEQAAELDALEEGERDFVIVIPQGWAPPAPGTASGLVAYAGNADPAQAQVSQGLLQQAVGQALFAPAAGGGGSGGFAAPVMQLGLFGVAFGFVQLKRTGALRRLFATPTSPAYFLSAQVLSRLIIGIVQVAILFGVGLWFGLQMVGDYATLLVIVLIGSAIFLAVGFAIAGWAKNEDQAAPVANLVSLPMMFLSGVFFPREAMPEFLRGVTQFMPLTYVNEALRSIVNEGAALTSLTGQLLGMGVWLVITFVLAVVLFRWE